MKRFKILIMMTMALILGACNCHNCDQVLARLDKLDTTYKHMEAMENSSFKSFLKLCALHGLLEDIEEIEEPDELIWEIFDQNSSWSDTVKSQDVFLRVFYESEDTLFIVAEHPTNRFNMFHWKYGIAKTDEIPSPEILQWQEGDHSRLEQTISQTTWENVEITDSSIDIGKFYLPRIQKIRYYEKELEVAGWSEYRCYEVLSNLKIKSK